MTEKTLALLAQLSKAMEEELEGYKKKIRELEGVIEGKNAIINDLTIKYTRENIKCTTLSNLLSLHTEFNAKQLFVECDERYDKCGPQDRDRGPQDRDRGPQDRDRGPQEEEPKKKTGKTFRVLPKVELVSEKPEEQEEKVKKVEDSIEELIKEYEFDVPYKETIRTIDALFDELTKSRVYKKTVTAIMQNRAKLIGKVNLTEYTKLVKTHIKRLEEYFSKKNDAKKVPSLVSTGLTPLEQRLVFYGQYFSSHLDADEIQRLIASLKVNMNYPRRFIPFSYEELYASFYDYSIAVCSLKENLKRVIVNPYGFSNIVYLENEKAKDDPYSFYILEKVEEDGKRYWKIEYRLDSFSKSLAQYLRNYCTDLFRRIYMKVFNDNTYRENYREQSAITQDDCDQLIWTIITLSKTKSFCNMLKDIVMTSNIIRPSEMDKFNFTADDKMNKRQFASESDSHEEIASAIKALFDDISDDDVEKIIREKDF